MARVGDPLPPAYWPAGAADAINRLPAADGAAARLAGQQRSATPADLRAWAQSTRAAAAAWHALRPWKRFRWSLCAWKHGDHAATPSARRGDAGFRLYLACYLGQHVTAGKQPISPCARRVWDQDASAWDYTP